MKLRTVTGLSGVFFMLIALAHAPPAAAAWHQGTISELSFGYDGATVTFVLSGWARSNCTCYSTWPNTMCLQRSRTSFKEEFAWLLAAKARDQIVNVFIDETSCAVTAMYEH